MTRNNRNKFEPAPTPTPSNIEDNLPGLPDLSVYRDEEKKHILDVLLRDEDLRNKHLARFIKLRNEVASLREKSQPGSSSTCARCQKPFGFIFNTGDICPKCCVKVCKQCRLMYNENENTWLCQLCCKQMQLMSYSGDWIYSLHKLSRAKTNSTGASSDSFQPFTSTQNLNVVSSSDSEPEELFPVQGTAKRFNTTMDPLIQKESKDPQVRVRLQKKYDEQRLTFVKQRVERRPKNASFTQPLPRRARPLEISLNALNSSSDELNALAKQSKNQQALMLGTSNSSILNKNEAMTSKEKLKTTSNISINRSRNELDNKSVQSSEMIAQDSKSLKDKLKVPRRHQSFNRGSLLSLASKTSEKSEKSSHKHISASMQSLRNAVHRISHPKLLSGSRISVNSEKQSKPDIPTSSTVNNEDTISLRVPDIQSRSSMYYLFQCIRRGLVVRISAFHAGGPGSIPGVGIPFFLLHSFSIFHAFV